MDGQSGECGIIFVGAKSLKEYLHEAFKIMNGSDNVIREKFFPKNEESISYSSVYFPQNYDVAL